MKKIALAEAGKSCRASLTAGIARTLARCPHAWENPIDPVVVDDPNAELHVREPKVGRSTAPMMNDLALNPSRL